MLESFLKKVGGLEARKSIKRGLQHRCFPVNIAKFLKNSFFNRTPLVVASGIETFLVCDTYNFKIYEDSMTQT